jgi:aspartate aminotransferase
LNGPQEQAERMVEEYQRRRDTIVEGLNSIPGVTCQRPQGAFYIFPNFKSFGRTSTEMADLLLDNAGVAVLPGTSFGEYGEGYLRLVYSNSIENIESALDRIRQAVQLS